MAGMYKDLTGNNVMNSDEILRLDDILSSVEHWGDSEIRLFGNGTPLMSMNQLAYYANQVCQSANTSKKLSNNDLLWTAVLNAFLTLLQNNYELATDLCTQITKRARATMSAIQQIRFSFLKELLKLCGTNNPDEIMRAQLESLQIINFIERHCGTEVAISYQQAYAGVVLKHPPFIK